VIIKAGDTDPCGNGIVVGLDPRGGMQVGARICNGLGIMRACLETQKLEQLEAPWTRLPTGLLATGQTLRARGPAPMKPSASRIECMLAKVEATLVPPPRKWLGAVVDECARPRSNRLTATPAGVKRGRHQPSARLFFRDLKSGLTRVPTMPVGPFKA
jgi:hypothetical protein